MEKGGKIKINGEELEQREERKKRTRETERKREMERENNKTELLVISRVYIL